MWDWFFDLMARVVGAHDNDWAVLLLPAEVM
jgi:hypothetical protein